MLRSSLSRPLLVRPFSRSSTWNVPTRSHSPQSVAQDGSNVTKTPASFGTEQIDAAQSSLLSSAPNTNDQVQESRPTLSAYDIDIVKQRIRSWTEQAALTIRHRADGFTSSTRTTFSQLGSHLNKVTGYEEIEALKRDVVEQENRINVTRKAARQAKSAYEEAVIQRSKSQREVNDLLQRKSSWTDNDVSRFTTLVRQDHLYEQEELRAKAAVDETEDAVEREFSQLMRLILARYHEEQVWSDKIRSASTYGSLAALGLNLLVFVLAIIVVEPWKRKRLAQTFERKIEELSADNAVRLDNGMREIEKQLVGHEKLLISFAEQLSRKSEPEPEPPEDIQYLPDLINTAPPRLSRRTLELAGVGAGALLIGVLGSLLASR